MLNSSAWGKTFQNQVEKDVFRAELAAQLAAADPASAPEAYFRGLVAEADRWLRFSPDGPTICVEELLPSWLIQADGGPLGACVEKARALVEDVFSPECSGLASSDRESPDSGARSALKSQADAGAKPAVRGYQRSEENSCGHVKIDWANLRDRAAQAAHHWSESLAGLPQAFPELLYAVARFQVLEGQFTEALEQAKLEALAELAAGAGHEINNPLAVIGGRAQLLLQQETDPEHRRSLALIVAQVRRAYEMIADLRLFARPPQAQIHPVDIAGLLDGLIEDIRSPAAEQAVVITRSGHPGPLEIQADLTQIRVALRAVLQNALEAIGRNGQIQIVLHDEPQSVHIQVQDTGPGIPPKVREHLFDPFYSARSAGRGLGLGLSKAWRIVVSNHHGRIQVDSTPGEGARLDLILPKCPPKVWEVTHKKEATESPSPTCETP